MGGVTTSYMREKLKVWHPNWNVDRFTAKQVAKIYTRERNRTVQEIMKRNLIMPKE